MQQSQQTHGGQAYNMLSRPSKETFSKPCFTRRDTGFCFNLYFLSSYILRTLCSSLRRILVCLLFFPPPYPNINSLRKHTQIRWVLWHFLVGRHGKGPFIPHPTNFSPNHFKTYQLSLWVPSLRSSLHNPRCLPTSLSRCPLSAQAREGIPSKNLSGFPEAYLLPGDGGTGECFSTIHLNNFYKIEHL